MAYYEVGENIRKIREQQGLSQEELAELANIHRVTLARYEAGRVDPGTQAIARLAEALGVSVDVLFGIEQTETSETETQPKTIAARILARGIDQLPKEQREQALNVMRAMFVRYADFFKGEDDDADT